MSLYPTSEDDGPVEVEYTDGTTEEWDRLAHAQSGMVTFYEIETVDQSTRRRKGENAKTVPTRKIEEIEFLGFGP